MRVLVAYDISDDRKRGRAAKFLEARGERRQLSVFLVEVGSGFALQRLKQAVLRHCDLRNDRACFVPLCKSCTESGEWVGAYPSELGGWDET